MILFPEGDESGKNISILIGFPRGLKPQHGWFTSLPSNIAKVVGLLVLQAYWSIWWGSGMPKTDENLETKQIPCANLKISKIAIENHHLLLRKSSLSAIFVYFPKLHVKQPVGTLRVLTYITYSKGAARSVLEQDLVQVAIWQRRCFLALKECAESGVSGRLLPRKRKHHNSTDLHSFQLCNPTPSYTPPNGWTKLDDVRW
jgi:hypothetical protein